MNEGNGPREAADQGSRTNRARRFGLLGLGAAGLVALSAAAWHRHADAHGRGPGAFGWPQGSMDPEAVARRIDAMTGWLLADVDATAEQRNRVAQIIRAAAGELRPLRDSHQTARRETLQLLAAPTLDRTRLETLRAEQMQLGDTASRRLLQATIDAAEVLTPEQRAKLAERWGQRMQRRRG